MLKKNDANAHWSYRLQIYKYLFMSEHSYEIKSPNYQILLFAVI